MSTRTVNAGCFPEYCFLMPPLLNAFQYEQPGVDGTLAVAAASASARDSGRRTPVTRPFIDRDLSARDSGCRAGCPPVHGPRSTGASAREGGLRAQVCPPVHGLGDRLARQPAKAGFAHGLPARSRAGRLLMNQQLCHVCISTGGLIAAGQQQCQGTGGHQTQRV